MGYPPEHSARSDLGRKQPVTTIQTVLLLLGTLQRSGPRERLCSLSGRASRALARPGSNRSK